MGTTPLGAPEKTKGIPPTPKPSQLLHQLRDAMMVPLCVRRHDRDGRDDLLARQPEVQVLSSLEVTHEHLEHRTAAIGQHRGWQALPGELVGET